MATYQFNNRIFLKCDKYGVYSVLVDGTPIDTSYLTKNQLQNPYIAMNLFISSISEMLRNQIDQYCDANNRSKFTGCIYKHSCDFCKKNELDKQLGTGCYLDIEMPKEVMK